MEMRINKPSAKIMKIFRNMAVFEKMWRESERKN